MTFRSEPPRTDWTGWTPLRQHIDEELREFRRRGRRVLFMFVALVGLIVFGFYQSAQRRVEACHNLNNTRHALTVIIDRGNRTYGRYLLEGSITRRQYDDAISLSNQALADLAPLHCAGA